MYLYHSELDIKRANVTAVQSEWHAVLVNFTQEYVAAMMHADYAMVVDTICSREIELNCMLSLISDPNVSSSWKGKAFIRPGEALASLDVPALHQHTHRIMDRRIRFEQSVSYWVGVLEALAARRSRLLVVTPFPLSIARQAPKLQHIHPGANLSGLSIRVLGVPISYSWNMLNVADTRRDGNWSATLSRLKLSDEWDPARNDVAFLGCGAYGLPLAAH